MPSSVPATRARIMSIVARWTPLRNWDTVYQHGYPTLIAPRRHDLRRASLVCASCSSWRTEQAPATPHGRAFMSEGALAGVRVVDLTSYVPGPYASMMLADLGADVLHVESPTGDPARALPDRLEGDSALHAWLGRGKSSRVIDLRSAAGHDELLSIVEEADVLIEGFTPGVAERLGVGPEICRARNPRLVYCSIAGEGEGIPAPGHDISYTARTGVLDQCADVNGTPVAIGPLISDISAGLHGSIGILAALIERERSELGQYISVSLMGSALAFAGPQLMKAIAGATPQRGRDLNLGGDPAYRTYGTGDGRHIVLGGLEPKFWSKLCALLERPELVEMRTEDPDRTHRELEELFRSKPRHYWDALLDDANVCYSPVNTLDEVLSDQRIRAAGLLVGEGGATRIASPLRLSRTPPDSARPAPPWVDAQESH